MTRYRVLHTCACGQSFKRLYDGQPCPHCAVQVARNPDSALPSVKVLTPAPAIAPRPQRVRQPDHKCGIATCPVMIPAHRQYCSKSCKGKARTGTHYTPRETPTFARVSHDCPTCGEAVYGAKTYCNRTCAGKGRSERMMSTVYETLEAKRTRAYLRAIEQVYALKETRNGQ